jgi:hypothetical protein
MLLEIVTGMLLAAAPDAAANESQPVDKPAERKICRKEIETGSLIKGKKICMTARQWQKVADANREEMESRASSGSQSGQ